MGSGYWLGLRREFKLDEVQSVAAEQLTVRNPSDLVSQELRDALKQLSVANLTKKNCSRLLALMSTGPKLNQRELVGLLRQIQSMKPTHTNGLECIKAALSFLCRTGAVTEFPGEVAALFSVWDEALVQIYSRMKRDGSTLHDFWGIHNQLASVVLEKERVDRVLSAKNDWAAVADDIAALSSGSSLGNRMFQFAHVHVAGELLAKFVHTFLERETTAKRPLTEAWRQSTASLCLREADRLLCKDLLCPMSGSDAKLLANRIARMLIQTC